MQVYCFATLLLLSLTALSQAAGTGQSHSVTWGARMFRDTHLERVVISQESRFLRVVTRDYNFKQSHRITQIVVTDLISNGEGGYAHLDSGGPNCNYAQIRFKSQRNKGFSFIVDFYGI